MEIKIDLDMQIDGDYTLEDIIVDAVANKLVNKVQTTVLDKANIKINELLDNSIKHSIETKVAELFEDFFNNPITVNESWNKSITYDTLTKYIQTRIEDTYAFSECQPNNIMLSKVSKLVESIVIKETDKANQLFKHEGERIAKAAIDNSNIQIALDKIKNTK